MRKSCVVALRVASLAGLLAVGGASAFGATLTGAVTTSVPAENLTTDGTIDWAIWDYQAGSSAPGSPSDHKLGGSGIGTASALSSTTRSITGTVSSPTYSYTDGTNTPTRTAAAAGALTDNTLNTAGAGVSVTITTGSSTQLEYAKVFVSGYNSVDTLTATLDGKTYTDSSLSFGTTRYPAVYTFAFQPDVTGDPLTIKWAVNSLNGGSTGNANADIQAVTLSNTPEPASIGLLAATAPVLMLRRRRASR